MKFKVQSLLLSSLLLYSVKVFSQSNVRDSLLQKYSQIASKKINSSEQDYVAILNEIGFQYRYVNNDSLIYFAKKALALSKEINDDLGIMNAFTLYGNYHADNGQNKRATEYYEQAYAIAVALGNQESIMNLISELANQYDYNGQPGESLKMYKKGIALGEESSNKDILSMLHTNLGILYSENNLHKHGVKEFLIADSINHSEKDTFAIALNLMNLSYGLLKIGKEEEALMHGNRAIDLLEKMNYPEWLGYAYLYKGEIALDRNNFEQANHSLLKAKNIINGLDDIRASMELNLALGRCMAAHDQIDSAEYYLNTSLEKATTLKDNQSIEKALHELYKLQITKNNTKRALDLVLRYTATKKINDSIRNLNNLILIGAEIDFKKNQNKVKIDAQEKIERQNLVTYAIIILVIVLTIVMLLFRRNALNQKKSNRKLKELNLAKDKVFSVIGKDLKKPIETLQEVLSLYGNNKVEDDEMVKIASTLKLNLDNSAFALNNLLYWAKSEMQSIMPSSSMVNLEESILEVLVIFDDEIKRKDLNIRCIFTNPGHIPISASHLKLILSNLLSNAIKFSNIGETIEINAFAEVKFVQIKICDKGIGITREDILLLNNGGHLESKLGTMDEKGTGIGLVLTFELVKLYKGQIGFKSNKNKGTCVELKIPFS